MENRWQPKVYRSICEEFRYDPRYDGASAYILDGLLRRRIRRAYNAAQRMIHGKTVLVAGAGPSLHRSINLIAKYRDVTTVIAADTAAKPLIRRGIIPHVIVTDLDGDIKHHVKAAQHGTVMVVHAHGDNIDLLPHVNEFYMCMGTTQTKSTGAIRNFGGFTDGDRAVFMADHFGAKKIILFGMDFGRRIGRYSNTAREDRDTKIRKMQKGKEWLEKEFADHPRGRLFTTSSGTIRGFESITYEDVKRLVIGKEQMS